MADPRIRQGGGQTANGFGHLTSLLNRRMDQARAHLLPTLAGLAVLLGMSWLYWSERFVPATVGMLLLGAALFAASAVRLEIRPLLAAILALNVGLVLLYFWSLDETHHIVLQVSPSSARATVDGTLVQLRRPLPGSGFGVQQGMYDSYRVQATGEARQKDTSSFLGRIGAAFRLAQPGSAWRNLSLTGNGGTRIQIPADWSAGSGGSWRRNRQGEWYGIPGASILFPAPRTYTLSVDLVRPDGTQTVVIGVDMKARGYALMLRFDQPDVLWAPWNSGLTGHPIAGATLNHLGFVEGLRRDLRLLLTGYLFALGFVALAIGLYPAVCLLLPVVSGVTGGRLRRGAAQLSAPGRRPQILSWLPPITVVLAGLAATSRVSSVLLDRIPHVQDSVAYLFQARILALGRFSAPAPAPGIRRFFAEEFIPFHGGQWFAQYPPGHPLMLAIGVLLGGAWLVGPILAALSLGFIYLAGRQIYIVGVGLLAALLGLASPFWLFLGSSYMSHPSGLFFTGGCLYTVARWERSQDPRWMGVAALLAGMDVLTRPLTAIGSLIPLAVYAIWRNGSRAQMYLAGAAGLALPGAFLLLYNWSLMGNPLQSTYVAWNAADTPGFGMKPGGLFTPGDGLWNTYQNLSMLDVHLFGWPYAVALSLMFLPFVLGAARRWDYILLASFLGVIVVYAFYHTPGLMYGPRYYYEALPAMLLLSARGAFELGRLPLRVWPRFGLRSVPLAAMVTPAVLLAVLISYNVFFYLPAQIPLYHGYNYSSAAELQVVRRAGIHRALVFVTTGPSYAWWDYGNVFFANDPMLKDDVIYARDLGAANRDLYPYFPGRRHYRLRNRQLERIN